MIQLSFSWLFSVDKLIHIETLGNPTLNISNIREIAKIAHEAGALLSVDETFASPYHLRHS
jgi:methionine-gamma-lyase